MSGESEPKPYLFGGGSEEEEESPCGSMSHLHRMGGASDGSDSSHDPPTSPGSHPPLHEDMEMGGNGSSGSGTESHGNDSHGNESVGSSNGNGKDSGLLESSGSNKSSNSQSPSPPSSSNAFSLMSSEQDHPSTSGCSSEQSAKAKTQKELFKTLKDLKLHLPADKRKGRSSTLHTLRYALRCMKQVKANEEYYQMSMINDSQPPGLDVSSYTIEEINSITSEYTLKNADIFAVAVSLITGKIVYISEQAAGILHCRKDEFKDRKFVEFLSPQDVSVFYSFTTPYRLPAWSMCTGTESSSTEFMQEKSFFCRISGGKEKDGGLQYYPFRMTPYLMKVQDAELSEEHLCCLILAERVHSGYEAPRIPADKRIFTTTHTPNCVFQDVDERAVPLLGYLPQDLIGTPVLLHLHPNDRPSMLAVHRKILQYMGQPFDHSSIRFCARNGEYVTIDTSWSSFVNPWSRKVSFVIGRHKVRMGPVNEDVFSAPAFTEGKIMDSDIQEITEQIHKLLLQPVHSMGSSGYGSHGSNGSHDQLHSVASSSDSNGNMAAGNSNTVQEESIRAKPRSFQEICKGVQMLKTQDQQASKELKKSTDTGLKSPSVKQKDSSLLVRDGTAAVEELKDQTMYSYQQISCLDSVIRYLDSCNIPITAKRKYQFSSNTTSSNSDEEKKVADGALQTQQDPQSRKKPPASPAAVVSGTLAPLPLPTKPESVVSITSQCSYSSTIVHVGDKKLQPESEIIEDVVESPAPPAPVSMVSPPTAEQGAYRKLELTKQVLAAHTQKEEQAFLSRCRELCLSRTLQKRCPANAARHRGHNNDALTGARLTKPGMSGAEPMVKRSGRPRKSKKLRMKKPDSSDSAVSQRMLRPPLQSLNQTSWSPSETSQSAFSVPYPTLVPGYPLYTAAPPPATTVPPGGERNPTGSLGDAPSTQAAPTAPPYPAPLVTPVVAFVLPNYVFPQLSTAPRPPFFAEPQQAYNTQQPFQHQPAANPQQAQQNYNSQQPFQSIQPQQAYNTQQPFQHQQSYGAQQLFPPQQAYNAQQPFQPQQSYTVQQPFQTQTAYNSQQPFQAQQPFPNPQQTFQPQTTFTPPQPFQMQTQFTSQTAFPSYKISTEPKLPVPEVNEGPSPPPSLNSPPLFGSHCSSPLQLDLLQLEDKPDSHSTVPPSGSQGICSSAQDKGNTVSSTATTTTGEVKQSCCLEDGDHNNDRSSSSDLMDLLMQEDSRSGTGSATSASTGSAFNGCNTSNSGTGSSNTSKYFGSVDSSENDHKGKRKEDGQNFKYVLQEPLWLLMSNADDKVMMTYQVPSRDMEKVLRDDRERLRRMQKNQPRFTSDQRRELIDQHPWMRRGGLPKAIDVKECLYCEDDICTLEEELPDMELGILGTETPHEEGVAPDQGKAGYPIPDSVS